MNKYVVMTSSAHMPSSCWGVYRNVAVVEVAEGCLYPAMISERARGVVRIVRHYGPQNVGKSERCAFQRTMREPNALANQLNGGE